MAQRTFRRRSRRGHLGARALTLGVLAAAGVLTLAPRAMASDRPAPRPTLPWLVTQLLPSPELAAGDGARFGLSWQLTPVLYSFGIHRRLSPWRSFVVEPLTRQSGSIELFAAPAYLAYGSARDRWSGRVGVRSYFPLVQRGENLSLSLGSYYFRTLSGEDAVAYELGSYVLYGFIGMRFAVAPAFDARRYLTTLSVRAF